MSLKYSNSDSARNSDRGSAVNSKITWDMLSNDDQKAITAAIEEKRILVFPNNEKCQLDSIDIVNSSIICKSGKDNKIIKNIHISDIIDKQYELLDGGSKKMKKRGGSKRRRTKRLRKNKKTGRTRRRKI
jgi:hypothetical protein